MEKMDKPEIVRHGELVFIPVDSIPKEAILIGDGKEILAGHSETGHHHIFEMPNIAVIEGALNSIKHYKAGGIEYFEVPDATILRHQKEINPHLPIEFRGYTYKKVNHQAYDYTKKIMRRTLD